MLDGGAQEVELKVEVPRVFRPLMTRARYLGAHGGRGSGKSHFFALKAVLHNFENPGARGVCIREVQNTIRDSVKTLIESKIQALGLGPHFEVLRDEIRGHNGSLIVFRGMQAYNAENIKSLEGFDWAWIEEAQSLSDRSLRLLRPTLRKDGSEIWAAWNPRHDTDPIDRLLRGANRPKDAVVVEANWQDNPWLSGVLIDEMERDYLDDPEMAEHVWGGGYEIVTEGSYFARLIAAAEQAGRVGNFPHDPARPVFTSWDLGIDDYTAVWFWQVYETHVVVIDYIETSDVGFDQIIAGGLPEHLDDERERQARLDELGRTTPYTYAGHFLPHDVRVRELGSGARERAQILRALGLRNIHKGAAANPEDRIAASRRLLPVTRFHLSSRVQEGLKRLRRYKKKVHQQMAVYLGPAHDENSHSADAFGEFAVNCPLASVDDTAKRKAEALPVQTVDDVIAASIPAIEDTGEDE